jgi:pimeloyl-ACP methyl ester carboxylesterase
MRFSIKSIRGNLEVPRGSRALVIMVHGSNASKDWEFFPWLAEVLCDEGLAVCRFNMSQPEDLASVVRHCQTRVALPTFLLGHAEGGSVALAAGPDVPNLRGVVVWSMNAAGSTHLSIPLLLINSAEIAGSDVSSVTISGAHRELALAAAVTARFICAYS